MLVARRGGVGLPTLFSLQSGTGVTGMLALFFHKEFAWGSRFWSLVRLLLQVIVPVLAILIMSTIRESRSHFESSQVDIS